MKFTGTCLISALLLAAAPAVHAVDFGAFADIRYDGDSANGSRNAFALGQIDLYATQKIDDKTRVFVEYVFEDPGDGFVVDLERLSITRTINPHFSIGAGRFHTPIGYWNTAYHHGALNQDTVSRPSFLDFEDGAGAILPMHVVGLMAMGQFDAGGGKLHYDLAVANGSSINTDPAGFPPEIDVNNSSDPNEQKSVMLHLSYFFPQLPMRVGVFGMTNTIAESGDIANGAVTAFGSSLEKQTLYGFDARYATSRFDALGEFYIFSNDDKVGGTGSHDASAYFLQFGYRVTDKLKPIYRYESVDFTAADTYFLYLGTAEGTRHVVGLRYDIDDSNALKLEINRRQPTAPGVSDETGYSLQWAFLMFCSGRSRPKRKPRVMPAVFLCGEYSSCARACKLRQRLVAELSFRLQHLRQHGEHAVGVERDRFDTFTHEPLRDLGIIRRRLAADADVFATRAAGLDRHLHEFQHRAVALVEAGDDTRIAVDAERELGEVVGADGEAVEEVEELVGEQGIRGYLAHHVYLEIALAAFETVFRHRVQHRARLLHAAHERDHQRDVGQAHGLAHLLHRRALHREAVGEALRRITRGAAKADHGIFFARLVFRAADQRGVFVGFEVAHAHDHGIWIKGRGDGADALGESLDVNAPRVGVAGDEGIDLPAQGRREPLVVDERARMDADAGGDDELDAREAHAVVRQLTYVERILRIADVDHDMGLGSQQRGEIDGLGAKRQRARVHQSRVSLGAGHGDGRARGDALRRVAATHDSGDAQFACDDGCVTGAAAAIGDDGGRDLHHRLPIGIGDVGHQHLARLELLHVLCL